MVASPANQFYLTGYDGWSFYTPQMVLVALDQEEPIWFGRKMDAVGAEFTVFMDSERIVPYDESFVGIHGQDIPCRHSSTLIQERRDTHAAGSALRWTTTIIPHVGTRS